MGPSGSEEGKPGWPAHGKTKGMLASADSRGVHDERGEGGGALTQGVGMPDGGAAGGAAASGAAAGGAAAGG